MNTLLGNTAGILALQIRCNHKIVGPRAFAIRGLSISCPHTFINMEYGINFFEHMPGKE